MVCISKQKLSKKILDKIDGQFGQTLNEFKNKKETVKFFKEFLTGTEKLMLIKRLALILMLEKKYSFNRIKENLKLSPTTVSKFWRKLKNDKFLILQEKVRKEKISQEFWKGLESLLRAGMPPIAGPGRWRRLYRLTDNKHK